jgi:hypothetical protein
MTKIIEFSTSEFYIGMDELEKPEPIKLHIPDWFKKIKHDRSDMTIKGCMPFLDTLSYGYVLKIPQDLTFKIFRNEKTNQWDAHVSCDVEIFKDIVNVKCLNLNHHGGEFHQENQWKGAKWTEQNFNLPISKIINPWLIKTPPGWSCLFTPPLNNKDDRFEIIPGIVDTDVFDQWINFPGFFNSYRYPNGLSFVLEKGTPYCQIIPFKRENWKMEISYKKVNNLSINMFNYVLKRFNKYKNKYWNKKSCS